jgi:hypothetical protein
MKFWLEKLREYIYRKSMRSLEHNIKPDVTEIWCECIDWIHLAQDRNRWRTIVHMIMNIWVS